MSLYEQGDILIRELFAGKMTASRHAELEDWLRKDPSHTKQLAEFAIIERLLFIEQKQLDASAILALLLEAEENAAPMLALLPNAQKRQAAPTDDSSVTFKQAYTALSYELRQSMRGKAKMFGGIGIAALCAIGLAIAIALASGSSHESPDSPSLAIDLSPQDPAAADTTPIATITPVATFTAEQDARWQAESGTLLPGIGADLHPGDRLTLTAGLAEITTGRGAIVVLEAPATIELTNDNNSIALLDGRLIGICETESSKGLFIRTPRMEITDLGTRFGVDATRHDTTEVHIFEGSIKVAVPEDESFEQERVFSAGQAVVAREQAHTIVTEIENTKHFAAIQQSDIPSVRPRIQITGLRSISGDLKAVPSSKFVGKDAKELPTDDAAFIFHDFVGRLIADTTVNAAKPGVYDKETDLSDLTIPAGTDLRSYVIYKTENPSGTPTKVQGSITFENEVIGIIINEATAEKFVAAIKATSPVFMPGTGSHRWADLYAFEEKIELSKDRRTVSFQFEVKESTDMIRVLVRTEAAEQKP